MLIAMLLECNAEVRLPTVGAGRGHGIERMTLYGSEGWGFESHRVNRGRQRDGPGRAPGLGRQLASLAVDPMRVTAESTRRSSRPTTRGRLPPDWSATRTQRRPVQSAAP